MTRSIDTAARERLEALVGEWTMEAGPPGGPPWPGAARVTFEWFEGAPLLIQRWHVDMPEAPDGVAVIGCDGKSGAYYQLYTDERDVQRIYAMSLTRRRLEALAGGRALLPAVHGPVLRGREDDHRPL